MTLLIAAIVARLVLVPVFAVAGLAKLADIDKTREMLAGFGFRRGLLNFMVVALPLVELLVAAALIAPPAAFAGALAASALLAMFMGVIAFNLSEGRHPVCNCFGQIGSAPIGPLTLVRNGVLTGMALLAVAAGPDAAATWRLDELFGVTPLAALLGAGGVVGLMLLLLIAAAQLMILHALRGQRWAQRLVRRNTPCPSKAEACRRVRWRRPSALAIPGGTSSPWSSCWRRDAR
jgi:hypothetical protein